MGVDLQAPEVGATCGSPAAATTCTPENAKGNGFKAPPADAPSDAPASRRGSSKEETPRGKGSVERGASEPAAGGAGSAASCAVRKDLAPFVDAVTDRRSSSEGGAGAAQDAGRAPAAKAAAKAVKAAPVAVKAEPTGAAGAPGSAKKAAAAAPARDFGLACLVAAATSADPNSER